MVWDILGYVKTKEEEKEARIEVDRPYDVRKLPANVEYTDKLVYEGRFDFVLLKSFPEGVTVKAKLDERSYPEIDLSLIRVIVNPNPRRPYQRLYITTSGTGSGDIELYIGGDAQFQTHAFYLLLQAIQNYTKALVDDSIKGILRSIGDAGDSPTHTSGFTVLDRLVNLNNQLMDFRDHKNYIHLYSLLTSTPLGANAVYNSGWDDRVYAFWSYELLSCYSDVDGTMYIEQSPDATHKDRIDSLSYTGGSTSGNLLKVQLMMRYINRRYVNGATAQSEFRLGRRWSEA